MDRKSIRNEAEWQSMVSEVQALRRKLHSKTEALLIITKDLDATQKERDQYKLMAEKLRVRCQSYKRQFTDFPITKDQASLIQMLRDTRNQKSAHQKQCEVLQQKLAEALGDVKLLRERFARQRIGDEGIGPRHFPAHEREELVIQLEDAKQSADHYRQEFNIANDQIAEIQAEKDDMAKKAERLNSELNFMLNGDKKRIIDIDALCMENKYLQERVKQCQDEKNSLHAQMSKLKALLNSRKAKSSDIKPGTIRNSGLVFSPKQIKQFLSTTAGVVNSTDTVSDLQTIAAALLETVNDKNLALHHLRNTNKILGKRVAELELKLKTLEVAGLWTLSGQRPPRSSPIVSVTPSASVDEEFFSSLGCRLSHLSDTCDRAFHKLVSLTPESASSNDDITKLTDDVTANHTMNSDCSNPEVDDSTNEIDVSDHHGDHSTESAIGDDEFEHHHCHGDQNDSDVMHYHGNYTNGNSVAVDCDGGTNLMLQSVSSHCDVTEFGGNEHLHKYDTTVPSHETEPMTSNCHPAQTTSTNHNHIGPSTAKLTDNSYSNDKQ